MILNIINWLPLRKYMTLILIIAFSFIFIWVFSVSCPAMNFVVCNINCHFLVIVFSLYYLCFVARNSFILNAYHAIYQIHNIQPRTVTMRCCFCLFHSLIKQYYRVDLWIESRFLLCIRKRLFIWINSHFSCFNFSTMINKNKKPKTNRILSCSI